MSVKVMGFVWDYFPGGGGELLTALALADRANHDGSDIYPSVDTLAKQTRQSRSTVKRHLKAMVASGWLVKVRPGGGRPGETTRYRIPVGALSLEVVERGSDWTPSECNAVH